MLCSARSPTQSPIVMANALCGKQDARVGLGLCPREIEYASTRIVIQTPRQTVDGQRRVREKGQSCALGSAKLRDAVTVWPATPDGRARRRAAPLSSGLRP